VHACDVYIKPVSSELCASAEGMVSGHKRAQRVDSLLAEGTTERQSLSKSDFTPTVCTYRIKTHPGYC